MPRTPYLAEPKPLNLLVEKSFKEDAKIFASKQNKSVGQILMEMLWPQVALHKERNPELYPVTGKKAAGVKRK